MKIKLDGKKLSRELAALRSIIPIRPPLPVLATVKLAATTGGITLTASDVDRHLECAIECEVTGGATFCIRADRLAIYDSGDVEITWKDGTATVKGSHKTSRIPTLDAGEFPPWPEPDKEVKEFTGLDSAAIAAAYDSMLAISGTNPQQFILTAPAIMDDGCLVCTNGKHATRRTFIDATLESPLTMTPNKIGLAMGGEKCTLKIGNNLEIVSGNRRYFTKRIAGYYPNVRRVAEQCWRDAGSERWVEVSRAELIDGLSYISSVCTTQKLGSLKVTDGTLTLWAWEGEERHDVTIEIKGRDVEPIGVGVDQFLPVVRVATGDMIRLGFGQPKEPFSIISDIRSVLMPLTNAQRE